MIAVSPLAYIMLTLAHKLTDFLNDRFCTNSVKKKEKKKIRLGFYPFTF